MMATTAAAVTAVAGRLAFAHIEGSMEAKRDASSWNKIERKKKKKRNTR